MQQGLLNSLLLFDLYFSVPSPRFEGEIVTFNTIKSSIDPCNSHQMLFWSSLKIHYMNWLPTFKNPSPQDLTVKCCISPYISLHSSQITTQPNGYFYFFLITKVTFYHNIQMTPWQFMHPKVTEYSLLKKFSDSEIASYIY